MEIVPYGPTNPGFELATFQSQVQHITDQATEGPWIFPYCDTICAFRTENIFADDYLIVVMFQVAPIATKENLSTGRAMIQRKSDIWMSFEEYSQYTK